MNNNHSDAFWFHIPVILIKIVNILTKKPSEQSKTIELERWEKSIKVATDPGFGGKILLRYLLSLFKHC